MYRIVPLLEGALLSTSLALKLNVSLLSSFCGTFLSTSMEKIILRQEETCLIEEKPPGDLTLFKHAAFSALLNMPTKSSHKNKLPSSV